MRARLDDAAFLNEGPRPPPAKSRNRSPGSSARSPVSHSSTLAPTSASSPSARRPSWPSNTASRGANSRVWSRSRVGGVAAVVGRQHQQVVRAHRLEPARDGGVDLAQRGVEARRVLAVAEDLVGVDEVREHEPLRQLAEQSLGHLDARRRCRARSASAAIPRPLNTCPTLPTACTSHPRSASSSRYVRAGGSSAKSRRPRRALERARLAAERPRDHPPDGVLARAGSRAPPRSGA